MSQQLAFTGLSPGEKLRRFDLLRSKLKEAGISCLLVYGGSQLGVPVQYLTQVWGTQNNMVIFPAEGEPVFLIPSNSGQTPQRTVDRGCWLPVESIRESATLTMDVAKILKDLKLQDSRIGIDSFIWWQVSEYKLLAELCPKAEIVDAHRLYGEIRVRKSEEELNQMKNAIRISDFAHYAFLSNLRPGMTEVEAAAKTNELLDYYDVGDRIILIHSQPEAVYPNRPTNAVIRYPNPVTFSPEFSRNAGYGAQMIRSYWWEKPQGVYKTMFELWAEMREMIKQEFRPGVEILAAGRKIVDLIEKYGFECDKLGHAIGISYGESPYVTAGPDEKDCMEWTIQQDETYAIHPMVRCKGYVAPFTMIGDMYYIGRGETEIMTTTLPGLPEMIPY